MPKLIVAMENQVLTLEDNGGTPQLGSPKLQDTFPQCVAQDPFEPERLYAATLGAGLWLTEDAGETWHRVGEKTLPAEVTSVTVDSKEDEDMGVVYAGTEPSSLYRSSDGGKTWNEPAKLTELPSSGTWSFPPKPDTHHVRYIAVDPTKHGLIYLAIEAGALIRSYDGGLTWKDRTSGGPYDTHTMATNPKAPGRVYSAAGDGYFESRDYGETWQQLDIGLGHHYLYCVGVHPSDPDTVLVSGSPGPWLAYNPGHAESYVYRKSNGESWERIHLNAHSDEERRSTVSVFVSNPSVNGEFYAANSLGVYKSQDGWRHMEKTSNFVAGSI
jgi:photosystem II stability/assembly factor-like uncharacterized protein